MATRWTKLDDGSWGVQLDHTAAPIEPGTVVTVTNRAGDAKTVTLGEKINANKWGVVYRVVPGGKPAPAAAQAVGDLGGVLAIFDRAKQNLKHPAIVLAVPEATTVVRITVAGERAKVPGSLNVADNDRFVATNWGDDAREWLGRVTVDGQYQPARAANGRTDAITAQLRRFAAEPAKVAKESAALTGRCVFCNQGLGGDSLTAKRSLAVGYGQTCARNFGLPWGETKLDIGSEQ